jgi:hypothetical protein
VILPLRRAAMFSNCHHAQRRRGAARIQARERVWVPQQALLLYIMIA